MYCLIVLSERAAMHIKVQQLKYIYMYIMLAQANLQVSIPILMWS